MRMADRGLHGLGGAVVLVGLPKLPYIMPVNYGKRSDTWREYAGVNRSGTAASIKG